MTDHSKSSETSERHLSQFAYSWWVQILLGLGIGVSLGGVVVAVIFLDRIGLIPHWVFGWISRDRETQKHQFRLALCGLFAFWAATRLVKLGIFGEIARSTYDGMLWKLRIPQSKPDIESHNRVCAVKNVRIAGFLVAFLTLEVFLSWRALGKPFVEHNLYDLLFRIVLLSVFFPVLLKISRCVPERLILGIVMIRFVTGWVFEYAPSLVDPVAGLVGPCSLVLWVLAFLTSLYMLVSSFSTPNSSA